ncbi:MAG: hypothetical protein V3U62_01395, partial [Sedimenticolaceae bacterium]
FTGITVFINWAQQRPKSLLVYGPFQLWQRVSQLLKEFKSVLMIKKTWLRGFYQGLFELVTIIADLGRFLEAPLS